MAFRLRPGRIPGATPQATWLQAVSFAVFLFLQFAPENLSRGGARQLVDELDDARHLEGGHLLTRPIGDRARLDLAPGLLFQDHEGLDRLPAVGVACPDHAGLL